MQPEPTVANGRIRRVSPVDLRELPPIAVASEEQVRSVVRNARSAQIDWEQLGFDRRAALMKKACKQMLVRRQEVVDIMLDEIGKYPAETMMSEALGPLDYLSNWISVARPAVASRKLPMNPLAFPGKRGTVDQVARGVVGVIAPWNFPLAYFFKPVFPALLCGNVVVIKPSEYAPRMAEWFVGVLSEFLPRDVVQVVHGDGTVGRALVRSGIDSLVFTGSIKTGREVLQLAAEQMIPCSVELGGKDPAIVLADCNLDRTVSGIIQWAMSNAGQSCGAIERVYVMPDIADKFVDRLADAVSRLRAEPAADLMVDVGPIINERQLALIESHVQDAVQKGARLLCGGRRTGQGRWFEPTVLDYCDHTMKVVTEETFGPVIPVIRVKSADEAVALANDSIYGLNASVWSENIALAEEIARQLEAGTVLVNNHAVTGAMPAAPWTGVKQTGYGVANSTFALSTFVRPRTVIVDTNKGPDPFWFPMNEDLREMGDRLADAQLGKFWRALKVPLLLQRRTRAILDFVQPRGTLRTPAPSNGSSGPSNGQGGQHPESNGNASKSNGHSLVSEAKAFVVSKLTHLTETEREWAGDIFASMFPGGVDPRIVDGAEDLDLVGHLSDMLENMPLSSSVVVRAAVATIALAPIVTEHKLATIGSLDPEARIRTLDAVGKSENYLIRSMMMLIKAAGALEFASASRLRPDGTARAHSDVVRIRAEA